MLSRQSFKNRSQPMIGAGLFILIALSGCGNIKPTPATAPLGSYEFTTDDSGGTSYRNNGDSLCSNLSPNVMPAYDFHSDGSERYTVCENPNAGGRNIATQTPAGIVVYSSDFTNYDGDSSQPYSRTVCIFPSQETIPGYPAPVRDPQTRALIYQCIQSSESGVFANFPTNITFNGVFIVPMARVEAMRFCLNRLNIPGDVSCPAHSYGTFR